MQIQDRGETISQANAGMQVAISMNKPIVGRHINEGDVLYVKVPEKHVKLLKTEFESLLSEDEIKALEEYIEIMRKKDPLWGI